MSNTEISMPVAKATSAITVAAAAKTEVAETVAYAAVQNASDPTWLFVMSIPWGTIASIFAASYTFILISEWWWKKLWRPLAESRGWIKPRKRYVLTEEEWQASKETDSAPL